MLLYSLQGAGNDLFCFRKKMCFVLKIFNFLYVPWICKLQTLWRHYQHYCILEILVVIFEDEIWWNITITYNEYSQFFLILIVNNEGYVQALLSFRPVLVTQQPITTSFKFLILLKLCTVAIKIINHQLLKVNWRHEINNFFFENHKTGWNFFAGFKTELKTY